VEELDETPSAEARALAEELRRDARTLVVARRSSPHDLPSPPASSELPALEIETAGDTLAASSPTADRSLLLRPDTAEVSGEPHGLPTELTRFFGREEEITRLASLLSSGTTRLVTVTGPGGSGKTRLAVAVARRLKVFFGGAIAFVPLADLSDAARIPDAIAATLGFTRSTGSELLEQVVAYLQGAPWLLVLDNYEHLVADGALLLRRLLDRQPTLTCLVTSRQLLGLSGEQELAELAVPELQGADPEGALALLGAEMDNFRAALAWAQTPEALPDASLRLTAALWPFWEMRGYHTEGREHLRVALSRPGPACPDAPERAQLFLGAATLAFVQFDWQEARALGQESLERFRALEDPRGIASARLLLGDTSMERGEFAAARAQLAEGLEYCRQCGWTHGSALACVRLGRAVRHLGDSLQAPSFLEQGLKHVEALGDAPFVVAILLYELGSLAVSHLEETVSTCREQRDRQHLALALQDLGSVFYEQGAYERARPVYTECLELFTQRENEWGIACTSTNLGSTLFHLGDPVRAQELYREGLVIYQRTENVEGVTWSLERLGVVEARQGDARKAARLLGAASAARERWGTPMDRWDQADWDQAVDSVHAELSAGEFDAAWAEGRARTLVQTIDEALS
jgi:tetratricopeptide (TPR) repeat protein